MAATPVTQKAEKCQIYQEIGGCYKGMIILQNSVLIRSISFKCIFVCLGTSLKKNKHEIPLALNICLEYSYLGSQVLLAV